MYVWTNFKSQNEKESLFTEAETETENETLKLYFNSGRGHRRFNIKGGVHFKRR